MAARCVSLVSVALDWNIQRALSYSSTPAITNLSKGYVGSTTLWAERQTAVCAESEGQISGAQHCGQRPHYRYHQHSPDPLL